MIVKDIYFAVIMRSKLLIKLKRMSREQLTCRRRYSTEQKYIEEKGNDIPREGEERQAQNYKAYSIDHSLGSVMTAKLSNVSQQPNQIKYKI